MAIGSWNLTTYKANILAHTPNDTSLFLRGDNIWANILTGALDLKGDFHLYTNSDDSPDIVWWYANQGKEQARLWMGNGGTSVFAPNYRCYNPDGTSLYSGNLVLGNGTGASGTWNISITGNAATATSTRYIQCPDTRSTNLAPTEYTATTTGVSFDFKQNSTISLNTVSSQSYSGVMTYRPYSSTADWTGGPAHQIAFDAVGLYWRTGTSSWNRWYKLFSNERMPMNSGLTGIASYGNAYQYGTIVYTNGISMRDPYTGSGNDCAFIRHIETTTNDGYLEIGVGDDGSEPIYVRQYNTSSNVVRTVALLDASGNSSFPGIISASRYSTGFGYINGAATNGGINMMLMGDDIWLGDCNIGGTLGLKSNNTSDAGLSFYGSDGSSKGRLYYNGTGHSTVGLYNAVWNDYAEFRKSDTTEPGYVICPSYSGIAYKSNIRLQAGARIISDTFGFVVGECDEAKTPVGLAGRVLAYPYRDRSEYKIGDAVCSAPGGTVDIMTRKEIMTYPDRIIGIVNEIPDYEIWESTLTHEGSGGQTTQKVEVKGRIWIDIK